ncbi:MAG: hypothetical protein K0S61_125 [Anaerocolumna sp.]|nr:hypothetical protein [Anaerocolumna sp.]
MEKPLIVKLDTKREKIETFTGIKRGDKLVIYLKLIQDSVPLSLTGLSLRANFKRPDKVSRYQDSTTGVTITNASTGEAKINVLYEVLDKAGIVEADVSIFEGLNKISSATFSIKVEESVYSDEAVEAREEFDILQQTIRELQDIRMPTWGNFVGR